MNVLSFLLLFFAFSIPIQAHICLVMVVGDDEKVIERSLHSVKEVVDSLCIYNENSTDETITLIHNFAQEMHIPLHIHTPSPSQLPPLVYAMKAGQQLLLALEQELSKSYLLVLESGTLLDYTEQDIRLIEQMAGSIQKSA